MFIALKLRLLRQFVLFTILGGLSLILLVIVEEVRAEIQSDSDQVRIVQKVTSDVSDLDDKHEPHSGIKLSTTLQRQTGIKTQHLQLKHYQSEFSAVASVLDLQPLLTIREQYLTALAEYQGINAALNFAQQALTRTEALYQNGVNSQRQLQSLQMQLTAEQARFRTSQYRLHSLSDNLLANWGVTLSTWVKAENNQHMDDLINARQALLLLTLPADRNLSEQTSQVAIEANGDRPKSQTASLISKAPRGSEISQGETYFLQTPRAKLRTGMRLSAWVAGTDAGRKGYFIPDTAFVWHSGQASIYCKIAPEQFIRQIVTDYTPTQQGYFVTDVLPDALEVVTTGAQLLLSQELRAIIPTEDDGDDD